MTKTSSSASAAKSAAAKKPTPEKDPADLEAQSDQVEGENGERHSPNSAPESADKKQPGPICIKISAEDCELGARGRVRWVPHEQGKAAIKAGEAIEASESDRAIAGI